MTSIVNRIINDNMNNDNGNIGIITQERIEENKKLDIGCTLCGCIPKPDEWSGQVEGVCIDCG